jgi:iron complex outermembrane receptor protein
MKRNFFCGVSVVAVALGATFYACTASAAEATTEAAASGGADTEVTVTGSLIAGTPENAALPVTVLTSDTLLKQGSPSAIEMIKALPEASGIIGESNQFTAGRGQGAEGLGTINLRGLGPERTLVLLNGHRLPLAAAATVDTISLPLSAIGRVEVLKDGAAATYGSDAIGGVVNFITKKNVNGLEVGGDWRFINGSDGDWTLNATWGHTADNWNFMISGGYQHRSELPVLAKDWAHVPYSSNPEGGWSGASNPTEFIPVGPFGAGGALIPIAGTRVDLGCTVLGGVLTNPNTNAGPLLPYSNCRTQYVIWDNLEEVQNSYQIYSEFNMRLGDAAKLHVEGEYSYTDIPHANTTPSFATSRPIPATVEPPGIPTGGSTGYIAGTSPQLLNFYFVPASNPGFAAYAAANPGQFPAGTSGAFISIGTFRPYLAGGNPMFPGTSTSPAIRHHQQWRFSADLSGDIGDSGVHWDTSLTYGEYRFFLAGRDSLTDRLELALRGLGGPSCPWQNAANAGNAALGCSYYNPFSNSIATAPRNGLTNPGFNSTVANNAALTDWFFPYQSSQLNYKNIEYDAVLSGKVPFTLPGGDPGWAVGFQWRRNEYRTDYSMWGNSQLAPCTDSGLIGTNTTIPTSTLNTCIPTPTAPTVFLGMANPLQLKQDIFAGYAELTLPIMDNLNFDLAARYEDYGSNGGHTFNPQFRGKWQVTDFFAIRGSVGTTFRAPPQGFLIPDPATSLQNVLGAFRPVETRGNPALTPEKATTYSVGGILEAGGFYASADYWGYDFKNILTSEPLNNVIAALFPNGTGVGDNCATLDPVFIANHFTFSGACSATNVTTVKLLRINGPNVKTDGVDINARYRWDDFVNGSLTIGGSATYIHKYSIASFVVGGQTIAGFDAVGKFNAGTLAYPLPQWKGNYYFEYSNGGFNIRWTARYTNSYVDQRTALFNWNASYKQGTLAECGNASAATAATVISPRFGYVSNGRKINAITLYDLAIRFQLPYDVTVTAVMNNVFDKDPPFARTEISYDALTGDPLGRTVQIGVQKRF